MIENLLDSELKLKKMITAMLLTGEKLVINLYLIAKRHLTVKANFS